MSSDTSPISPRLLKGFRDTLPKRLSQRMAIINQLSERSRLFGFLPLETPTLDYAEILQGKLGDEGDKLLYKFEDHGGRKVAMRYDFTVPLARVMAQNSDLPRPFKRYQVGPVWRADNTQRGRYREFYQFDLDIAGSESVLADAEILVLACDIMKSFGLSNFKIRVNDRRYLALLVKESDLHEEHQKIFYTGLDKWDKVGGATGVTEYWQSHGISASICQKLIQLLKQPMPADQPIMETLQLAESMGLDKEHFVIDPSIVRGLDYYTGMVFETTLPDAPEFGSVFSGGRYDSLVGRFSKQAIPAVGASLGLDRLMSALEQLGLLSTPNVGPTAYVTIFNKELLHNSLEAAKVLRQAGIATELSQHTSNLGKQLKDVAKKQIPYVIIIGPDEATAGLVTVRSMKTGEESRLSLNEVASMIA